MTLFREDIDTVWRGHRYCFERTQREVQVGCIGIRRRIFIMEKLDNLWYKNDYRIFYGMGFDAVL